MIFSIVEYIKKSLVTTKYTFLIVLIFHELYQFKLFIFINYDDTYFEYRKCYEKMTVKYLIYI